MASNYPPGVTGREYEIAGPDREWEEHRTCIHCGKDEVVTLQAYGSQVWFHCQSCGTENDLSDEFEPGQEEPDLEEVE
jgi:transcription elongation factor Elf1